MNPDFTTSTRNYTHIVMYLLIIFLILLNIWIKGMKTRIRVPQNPSIGIITFLWDYHLLWLTVGWHRSPQRLSEEIVFRVISSSGKWPPSCCMHCGARWPRIWDSYALATSDLGIDELYRCKTNLYLFVSHRNNRERMDWIQNVPHKPANINWLFDNEVAGYNPGYSNTR
jgi:hypothetical protein